MNNVYSSDGLGPVKVVRNSLTSVLRFIASVPIPFLLVPFMLQQLGTRRFGVWALVSTMSAFVQLGDFGIGYALVKSVAEMKARNDIERLNNILSTALVLYTIIAGIMGLLAILLTGVLVNHIFRIPVPLVNEAEFVVIGTAIIFCLNLVLSIFISVINGIQRIDVSNGVAFGMTIVNAIGAVIMLSLGQGLKGLVVNNGITTIGAGLVSWLAVRKLAPDINLGLGRFRRQEVKPILTYGANIQITNLAGLAGDPLVKTMISNAAGIQFVAYYEVAMRLMNPIRFLFAQAIGPLMPFAAESHADANLTAIVQIYQKSIRFVVLLALPLFALTFVAAPAFMVAWVGHGYAISARTFQILLVGQFASVVSMPSYYIFLSTHVRYTAVIAVLNGILDVVMCLGLGYFYGYSGIIVGFTLVMLILSLLSIYLFYRTFHIQPLSLFRYVPLRSVVFSIILAVSLWGLLIQWPRPGFVGFTLIGLIFGAAYCAFLWYSHLVSDDEVRGFTQVLKVVLR